MANSKVDRKQAERFVGGFITAFLADVKANCDVPMITRKQAGPTRLIARELAELYLPVIERTFAEQQGFVSLAQVDLPRYGREAYAAQKDLLGIDYAEIQREYDMATKPQHTGGEGVEDDMQELIALLDEKYAATRP
jgi:hypothetical protein